MHIYSTEGLRVKTRNGSTDHNNMSKSLFKTILKQVKQLVSKEKLLLY